MAAYAGILDGESLWLALEATPGTIGLRDEAGEVHPLRSDLAEDDPEYRSVRAGLLDLPGEDEQAYEVVLVPPGGRGERLVWTAPFPSNPTRVPPSRDGRWQLSLGRTEEGTLLVRRTRPAPALDVLDLAVSEDGIRVTFVGGHATELRLVAGDTVLARYPVTRDGDRQVATITEPELPEAAGQLVRLVAGELPLRRRANDLATPNNAVLLPVLLGDDLEVARLRLRWSPDGYLVARIVARDEADDS